MKTGGAHLTRESTTTGEFIYVYIYIRIYIYEWNIDGILMEYIYIYYMNCLVPISISVKSRVCEWNLNGTLVISMNSSNLRFFRQWNDGECIGESSPNGRMITIIFRLVN